MYARCILVICLLCIGCGTREVILKDEVISVKVVALKVTPGLETAIGFEDPQEDGSTRTVGIKFDLDGAPPKMGSMINIRRKKIQKGEKVGYAYSLAKEGDE